MILEKEVKMVINQYNVDYYSSKLNTSLKIGTRIMIPIDLLPETSGVLVHVKCEYCGEIFEQQYRRYKTAEKTGKHCCKKCRYIKIVELSEQRYGTKCTLTIPSVKKTMVQNNLKKYGTTHSVTKESYAKRAKTMKEKYGCEFTLQSKELRAKVNNTMFTLGNCGTFSSKQQEYLCKLFNGISNYPVGPYHVDCFIEKLNIGIEYSGSGHDLSVKLGHMSQKKFEALEKARVSYFKNHNVPILELCSTSDVLPDDSELIEILNNFQKELQNSNILYKKIIFPY